MEFQKYNVKEKKKRKREKKVSKIIFLKKGTKLITNTKKLKLKSYSRVWNFKNTMLKKRRRKKRKRKRKKKQGHKNYKKYIHI